MFNIPKEGQTKTDGKIADDDTTFKVINKKGTELPSTGGMGTKAFVAGGGLTALLAGVWLTTKKRMGKED